MGNDFFNVAVADGESSAATPGSASSPETSGKSLGFAGENIDYRAHYLSAASQFFRPELVNRLDQLVAYHPLSREDVTRIARRVLDAALAREGLSRRGVKVRYGDDVVARLGELGFDVRYGARSNST